MKILKKNKNRNKNERQILTYIRTINKQKSTDYSVLLLITSE